MQGRNFFAGVLASQMKFRRVNQKIEKGSTKLFGITENAYMLHVVMVYWVLYLAFLIDSKAKLQNRNTFHVSVILLSKNFQTLQF